jgi:hypothetical protein
MEKFVGLVDFSGHSAQTARSNALTCDLDIYRAAQATIKAPGDGAALPAGRRRAWRSEHSSSIIRPGSNSK